ncbi:hypothetical protein MNBD_DELTA01-1544 [hydrothermal vent metagenome]|uniref:Peptidase C39 domain-containing protein n=1 Tax=hydrothermal vent metagenome TaxID=652676 RepID=A0A3B0QUI9_9ZZZZ
MLPSTKTINKKTQLVIQEEKTGCAIASVAAVVGTTYAEVKARANSIGIFATDDKLYSETNYVRRLLKEYDTRAAPDETPFRSWETLPELALLAIKHHLEGGRPFWHWVVFSRENGSPVILDSAAYLKNNIRRDFYRIKPRWYIKIISRK